MFRKLTFIIGSLILGSLILSISAAAQHAAVSKAPLVPDPGVPDTLWVESKNIPLGTTKFSVQVSMYNDQELGGNSNGLTWDSPNVACDSVSWVGSRVAYLGIRNVSIDNPNRRVLTGAVVFTEAYIQPGAGLYCTVYFSVTPGALDQVIAIDSTFFPPSGDFVFALADGTTINPQFRKGLVRLGNPATSPVIAFNPPNFSFTAQQGGSDPSTQLLNISNTGPGTLNWNVTKKSSWLTLNPASGSQTGQVTVAALIGSLTAGTYRDTIEITDPGASNSPQRVPVLFTVTPPPPTIVVNPTSIDLTTSQGQAPANQQISISNGGGGTLNWTASEVSSWFSINPPSGSGSGTLTVNLSGVSSLGVGTHRDTITVAATGATNTPVKIPVVVTVEPVACLQVMPTTVTFIGYAGSVNHQNVSISNCGVGTLQWQITGINAPWLTVLPASGSGDATVDFQGDLTGLAAATYYDTVTVSSPLAGTLNSPQQVYVIAVVVPESARDTVRVASVTTGTGRQVVVDINYVNFTVTSQFTLPLNFSGTGLSCDSVSFVGSRFDFYAVHTAAIDNVNGTIAIEAVPQNQTYIAPGSGLLARLFFTVDVAAPTQLVPIDSGMIAPNFEFIFSDMNGGTKPTQFVAGQINISQQPCFEFPTDSIAFIGFAGEPIDSQVFAITNSCGPGLSWSVADDAPWLTVTPASGGAGEDVVFKVNTLGLGEGTFVAIVTFTSNAADSPFEAQVTLQLAGRPNLALSTYMTDLGRHCITEIVSGWFDIQNVGTGVLSWSITAGPEVDFSSDIGTGNLRISYSITTDQLPPGPIDISITVTAPGALNSPRIFTARLEVVDCDACSFDISESVVPSGKPALVYVFAHGIQNVAGLQFHIAYDSAFLTPDSITSEYLTSPTIGYSNQQIHYIWENLSHPVTIPDGRPIIALWFTAKGTVGSVVDLEWVGDNEIVDPLGNIYFGTGFCNGSVTVIEPYFDVAGSAVYYDMVRPIREVTVAAGTEEALTDNFGEYQFIEMMPGPYSLQASRTSDDPGVSVADAIKIRRHIATVEIFDSPYKMIAADVNKDAKVSVADVILIRRYIALLGPLPSGNWTFVDSDFGITMVNWPIAPRLIDILITWSDIVVQPFVGIRMGDVNNTWSQPAPFAKVPSGPVVKIELKEPTAVSGDLVQIPVAVSNAVQMAGIEMHLTYDASAFEYAGVTSDLLQEITSNGGTGAIHLVWEDFVSPREIIGAQSIMNLTFRVKSGTPSEIAFTGAEVANASGETYALELSGLALMPGAALPTAYALEQNHPNPFNPSTTIRAAMKEAGSYRLIIFNVMGQKIKEFSGQGEAGVLEFIWDGRDETGQTVSSGLYLYRLEAGSFSQTKKMVLMK